MVNEEEKKLYKRAKIIISMAIIGAMCAVFLVFRMVVEKKIPASLFIGNSIIFAMSLFSLIVCIREIKQLNASHKE